MLSRNLKALRATRNLPVRSILSQARNESTSSAVAKPEETTKKDIAVNEQTEIVTADLVSGAPGMH